MNLTAWGGAGWNPDADPAPVKYLVAQNGVFRILNTPVGRFQLPWPEPAPEDMEPAAATTAQVTLSVPRIPAAVLDTITPDGMHMVIQTGHQTFDNACNLIAPGSVRSNVQRSEYIRPYHHTVCNGQAYAPGYLQRLDLDSFPRLPAPVRDYVKSVTQSDSVILYQFSHSRRHRLIVDGYVVTTTNHDLLQPFVINPRGGQSILAAAIPYIVDGQPA